MVHLDGLVKTELVETVLPVTAHLHYLMFATPWSARSSIDAENLGADLPGSVNDLLPACPRLQILRCHDPKANYIMILRHANPKDLVLTVDCQDRMQTLLESTQPLQTLIQYQVWQAEGFANPHIDFTRTWQRRGWRLGSAPSYSCFVQANHEFYSLGYVNSGAIWHI